MPPIAVHVDRKKIRDAIAVEDTAIALKDGETKLAVEGFALTANNVTYAATGEVIGYWKFYPTDIEGKGIVPIWGFARVTESKSPHLELGARVYGFLPMSGSFNMTPQPRGQGFLVDAAEHRADLPPVYNRYTRVSESATIDDARRAIFQPLLVTSYLLYDFLDDNDWFGAEQIIIGSASSKTGLGLAKFLTEARPDGPRVIGLTSAKNTGFVDSLNATDQIVTYDAIEAEIAQVPSVYVDMAGNADVRGRLHHHLGDNMRHSAAVGTSHWDKFEPTGELPGARPRFFFAPSQIEKRRAEWGPGVIDKKLDIAWRRIADDSGNWMKIEIGTGWDHAIECYKALADGKVDPATGHYILVS